MTTKASPAQTTEDLELTPISEWLERTPESGRRKFRASSGFVYGIQPLSAAAIIAGWQTIPDPTVPAEKEPNAPRGPKPVTIRNVTTPEDEVELRQRRIHATLVNGVWHPRIGTGEGEVRLDQIPVGDQLELFAEIVGDSGMSKAAGNALRPTSGPEGSV